MSFQFKKAEREKVFVKLGLLGPSGSGKTYSALKIATGMAEELLASGKAGTIAVADSEGRRALYYANEFDFLHVDFQPPYTPERYVEVIDEAVKAGIDILVLDSSSHEWIGPGGCLEMHSNMPGNSYTNWNKITPRHDKFISKILRSPIHLICTIRGKDQYVLSENEKGKQEPKKVGVGGQQREGLEYELTSVLLLQQDTHIANATKDNTHLFDGKYFVPTTETGRELMKWANSGNVQQAPPPEQEPKQQPVNWPAFWAEVKKIGYTDKEVHEYAGPSLKEWKRDDLAKLLKDLKAVKEGEMKSA